MTVLNPIGQLAVLLTRADEQDRAAARQVEDAAEEAAMNQADQQVAELRAKAGAEENAAFAEGIGEIAGGACSIWASLTSPSTSTTGASAASKPSTLNVALSGGAVALPAAGKMVGGVYTGDAGRDNAEATRFEAQSQADIRRYDRAQSDAQAADQSIQRVEQFLEQTQQTENATRLAAATFRA
jgi:hypothetical protein